MYVYYAGRTGRPHYCRSIGLGVTHTVGVDLLARVVEDVAVAFAADRALVERHDVLRNGVGILITNPPFHWSGAGLWEGTNGGGEGERTHLSECARLVGEDVLDLPQLLVQRGCPRLGRRVRLLVVHVQVPADDETQRQSDHLHAETQVSRHQSLWSLRP